MAEPILVQLFQTEEALHKVMIIQTEDLAQLQQTEATTTQQIAVLPEHTLLAQAHHPVL